MADLLFEIGCEELPARDTAAGIRQLAAIAREHLKEARLGFASLRALGTPRRLVLHVQGLADAQTEVREWVRGPSESAAFRDGEPTPAALGFARSRGVAVGDLAVRDTPQGRYLFAEAVDPGRPAREVLAEVLPAIAASLQFPKTMRWGSGDERFARPVRWVVALLGEEVVPCSVMGVASGRATHGHRVLAPGPHEVADPEDYFRKLDSAYVVVDPAERRQLVATGVQAVAARAGRLRARVPEELLEEVVHLVEFPTPFLGAFDPEFLELPEAVLETVMRVHQRYFPVEDAGGRLVAHFVGVRNGGREGLEEVVLGNERVLRARFADARFFHAEDLKRPLAERVRDLAAITYLEGFGSLADRTARLRDLVATVAGALRLTGEEAAQADRAALLSKADQTTHLVYEFPELEGRMGEHYAALQGEPAPVARAIAEQYLPQGAGDDLPESRPGTALAIADRLDAIACGFLAGRQPTGSQDPFGLRRAAIGLLRIFAREPRGVRLDDLVEAALERALRDRRATEDDGADGAGAGASAAAAHSAHARIMEFLEGRLRVQMLEAGLRHDVLDAVFAVGWGDVAETWWRARAMRSMLARPDLDDVVTAFRRAANLAAKLDEEQPEAGEGPGEGTGPGEEERALAAALGDARERAERALSAWNDAAYFDALAGLRPAVDSFLDNVLVMDADPGARHRKLALLAEVARLGRAIGDVGRLAIAGEAVSD